MVMGSICRVPPPQGECLPGHSEQLAGTTPSSQPLQINAKGKEVQGVLLTALFGKPEQGTAGFKQVEGSCTKSPGAAQLLTLIRALR